MARGESASETKLSLVAELESSNAPVPALDSATLDAICTLEIAESDRGFLRELFNRDSDQAFAIIHHLAGRNLSEELPVQEKTMLFRRNLSECQKLKASALEIASKGKINFEDPHDLALLEDVSMLMVFEKRKAAWLEEYFYPHIYGAVVDNARSEVTQLLIAEKGRGRIDFIQDTRVPSVRLVDRLNYLLAGNDIDSAGVCRFQSIEISLPEYYTDEQEWLVFQVVVHELVHAVSAYDHERSGLLLHGQSEADEVNEAVTELTAYKILKQHIDGGKRFFRGQNSRNLNLATRPYAGYIANILRVADKVPVEKFVSALLGRKGFRELNEAFGSVFDGISIRDFIRALHRLYSHTQEEFKPFPTLE